MQQAYDLWHAQKRPAEDSAVGSLTMARSRRKTPLVGVTTARGDKPFKVDEHRSERRTVRVTVRKTLDGDDRTLHAKRYGDHHIGVFAGVHNRSSTIVRE
jgi:hypothetical protein